MRRENERRGEQSRANAPAAYLSLLVNLLIFFRFGPKVDSIATALYVFINQAKQYLHLHRIACYV